ncbi:hypothetical protein LTT66_16575 [Nocardia gipuzkoensis]|uniref:hypothetical protein n=1 Tax=Nocardia gipuzkoensis TaxID=2749991 RepID=UPI001E52049F|nr:hypothetical protein [Nocardia gipuzkoensis]UGT71613.1 hypothetical protein LTT66_16575 [Nocardia gipuzkoensis]
MSIVHELRGIPAGFGIDTDFGAAAAATKTRSGDECGSLGRYFTRPYASHSGTAARMMAARPKIRAMGFTFVHRQALGRIR